MSRLYLLVFVLMLLGCTTETAQDIRNKQWKMTDIEVESGSIIPSQWDTSSTVEYTLDSLAIIRRETGDVDTIKYFINGETLNTEDLRTGSYDQMLISKASDSTLELKPNPNLVLKFSRVN